MDLEKSPAGHGSSTPSLLVRHREADAETEAGAIGPPKNAVYAKEDGGNDESSIATTAEEEPVPTGGGELPEDNPTRPDTPPEAQRSKARKAFIMSALCVAVFLAALDTTIVTTALPSISEHFHSSAGYTWIGSAYLLGAAASTPLWGKFSDIFGRKPILLIANVVFFVGSLLAAVAVNIPMLISARAIQGCGGGGLIVLVNICIGDLFSMRSRGAYYGMIGGVWALASAIGPLLGGVFAEKVSWRWCFYINLPLDGAAFIIIVFFLNNLHTPRTPVITGLKAIDWVGSLTIVGGTLMLLLGLQFGGQAFPWKSATVICLIVFGVLTIGLFIINEWLLAKYPIIPLHIFRHRSNIACLLVCFCHGYVFIGGSYYLPLYFQACLGATPLLSGVYTLASALSLSFASAATGVFIRKTGQYLPPIYFGMAVMTLGYGLFTDLDAHSSWAKIFFYQIVAGIGVGPLFQAPLIALQSLVPPKDIAAGTATFQFTRNISTSISVVIGAVVFQNTIASQSSRLTALLGPATAARLGGFNAGANVSLIDSLPENQRVVAREVFAESLHDMWIMYVCVSALGVFCSFLITRQTLVREHETTKTGLAEEELKRKERVQRRKAKKVGAGGVMDLESANADVVDEKQSSNVEGTGCEKEATK